MFKNLYHKIKYFSIQRLIWKFKNAFKYAKIGYSTHCSCCYDTMLTLMRERLEQMEPHYAEKTISGRKTKNIRISINLLKRIEEDDYFSDIDSHPLLSRTEAAKNNLSAEQRDWEYLCKVLKKHALGWWY